MTSTPSLPDPDATSVPGPAATPGPGLPATGASDASDTTARKPRTVRKQVLLRLDPAVHDAVTGWADDELRSVNAQIEVILREALKQAGRTPRGAAPIPRRGRPPAEPPAAG